MRKFLIIAALLMAATRAFAEGVPQTTCPVMKGSPIHKSSYADVEGYRIYTCCGGCNRAIQADPGKYIAQLQAEGVGLEKAAVDGGSHE